MKQVKQVKEACLANPTKGGGRDPREVRPKAEGVEVANLGDIVNQGGDRGRVYRAGNICERGCRGGHGFRRITLSQRVNEARVTSEKKKKPSAGKDVDSH